MADARQSRCGVELLPWNLNENLSICQPNVSIDARLAVDETVLRQKAVAQREKSWTRRMDRMARIWRNSMRDR